MSELDYVYAQYNLGFVRTAYDDYFNKHVATLSGHVGLPVDVLKMLAALMLTYPVGFVHKYV